MFEAAEFTEHLASMRVAMTNYRRSRTGGMTIEMVVEDDDKHTALDLIDGGEIMVRIEVYGVPR